MWFHWQGAMRLLRRRTGPVLRMVVVAFIGSVWCLVGTALGIGAWRDLDGRAGQLTVDIVARDSAASADLATLVADLRRRPIVASAALMSRDDVWADFARDLQLRADDLREVAHVPVIARITLRPHAVRTATIDGFVRSVRDRYPETVASVVWPTATVDMIDRSRRTLLVFGGAALLLSLIVFVVAVAYAFRAEIHRAGADLRVADLMGATPGWIAAPHLLVSIIAGAGGLILSATAVVLAAPSALEHAPWLATVRTEELALTAGAIALLGLLLSWWQSVRAVKGAVRVR